jgi:hypothetical protein
MRTRHLYLAASLLLSCATSAQAQVQYRAGPLLYTPGVDFTLGPSQFGAGYYIEQAYIASPPQPTVGQRFYVNIVMSGIVNQPVGRVMAIFFAPPNGTTVVADPATPVRCWYRAGNGGGNYVEFTNQVLNDTSLGGNLRIFGCRQPAAGPNPYPIAAVPGGNAYEFARDDPQNSSPFFPMPYQASYVIAIPLVATRSMDGISANNQFVAAIRSIQGDSGDPWVYPQLALLVHPAATPASADMRASITQGTGAPAGFTRLVARCTNFGPDAAQNASCSFGTLPAGATASCVPASPQATLAPNQFIECTVQFPFQQGGVTVEVTASSATPDPVPVNNGIGITMQPGTGQTELIFEHGFE